MTTIDQPIAHDDQDTPAPKLWVPTASHTDTPTPTLWVPTTSHPSHSATGAVAPVAQDTPAPVAHDTHESSRTTGAVAHLAHNATTTTGHDDPDTTAPVARDTHESSRTTDPTDPDTTAPVAHHTEEDDTMHVAEIHRDALIALPRKVDQIHYICGQLGHPETAEVRHWLDAIGAQVDSKYVSRIVNKWRNDHNLTDTDTFRALNAYDLADLEPDETTAHAAPAIEPPTNPPASADVPAGYPPAIAAIDPDASDPLAAEVRRAQARLPLQSEEALLTALSDDEIKAERELAEWERATDRKIRRSAKAAQLANVQREQATAEAIAKSEANDARWLQRAVSARRRLVSPDAKLAQLHRNASWSSWGLIGVVLVGMVWSAVNVQRNLVPDGDMGNPLYWLSFGIEAMISVPLIAIMVAATTAARWGRELPRVKVIPIELALLTITIGLNAGPHLGSGSPSTIAEFAIAPIMVGVVIWLHAWLSGHYATLITGSETTTTGAHQ